MVLARIIDPAELALPNERSTEADHVITIDIDRTLTVNRVITSHEKEEADHMIDLENTEVDLVIAIVVDEDQGEICRIVESSKESAAMLNRRRSRDRRCMLCFVVCCVQCCKCVFLL